MQDFGLISSWLSQDITILLENSGEAEFERRSMQKVTSISVFTVTDTWKCMTFFCFVLWILAVVLAKLVGSMSEFATGTIRTETLFCEFLAQLRFLLEAILASWRRGQVGTGSPWWTKTTVFFMGNSLRYWQTHVQNYYFNKIHPINKMLIIGIDPKNNVWIVAFWPEIMISTKIKSTIVINRVWYCYEWKMCKYYNIILTG